MKEPLGKCAIGAFRRKRIDNINTALSEMGMGDGWIYMRIILY
jgi:hypothetical protein